MPIDSDLHVLVADVAEAEEALRRRYRTVELAVREGTMLLDGQGCVIDSTKADDRLGIAAADLRGGPPLPDGWTMTDDDGVLVDLCDHPAFVALRTGRCEERSLVYTDPKRPHDARRLRFTAYPIDNGSKVAIDLIVTDEDRRDRTRERLEDQETRFRTMTDMLPVAVWESTAFGQITYVNPKFTALTGLTAAETPDAPTLEIVHPDDLAAAMAAASDFASGDEYDCQYRILHTDGTARWVTSRVAVLRDDLGAMTGLVGAIEDIHELRRAEEYANKLATALAHTARHDPLTGLANRIQLDEVVARTGVDSVVAVFYVDIDHFKRINDEHGHASGDAVLMEVAHRLRSAAHPDDLVVRLGGDEIAIWSPHTTAADAAAIALRLVEAVGATPVVEPTAEHRVTVTVGVALGCGVDGDDLIRRADSALYEAKRGGRNRFAVAAPT